MTIYGECIGALQRMPVTISALGGNECELQPHCAVDAIEARLDLWIGAIGPLSVMTEDRGGGRFGAKFHEPLDERIIAHFAHL